MIATNNLVIIYNPELGAALKALGLKNPTGATLFIQQLSFWLNTKSGYITKDGDKFIHNTYEQWRQQFASFSISQIGRIVRELVSLGIFVKDNFAGLKRRLTKKPIGFQDYNQTSWMTLCIDKLESLILAAGCSTECLESLPSANVQERTLQNAEAHNPKCESASSTIYTEKSLSLPETEKAEKERQENYQQESKTYLDQEEQPDPWLDDQENGSVDRKEEFSVKTQNLHEDQFSAAPRTTKNTKTTEAVQKEESKPKLKSEEVERPLYVWEDQLNYPNEIFLNWWAVKHYKPQGGKWETGARSFARSQFYKNPAGADIIYQEFLQFFNTVANNAHQQQNQNIQAILPSCFVKYPEVNQENKEQLGKNVATVAARGAGVALPGNVAPCSTQHMSLEEASANKSIKPLANLEQPALSGTAQQPTIDLEELTKQVEFANKKYHEYKDNPANARWFRDIINWVNRTPGVVVTDSGISLEASLLE